MFWSWIQPGWGISGHMTIDILNWYPWSIITCNQHPIDMLVDAPLTSLSTVCQQSINFWSMDMGRSTLGQLSTSCWLSSHWLLIEMSLQGSKLKKSLGRLLATNWRNIVARCKFSVASLYNQNNFQVPLVESVWYRLAWRGTHSYNKYFLTYLSISF